MIPETGQRKKPERKYKDLKQKQKMRIANWMFEKTCDFYREHDRMPEEGEQEMLAEGIYARVQSSTPGIPYDEIYQLYLFRLPRYEIRIAENGLPEKKEKKKDADKPKVKQKGRSKKVCPNCGRKMKQQFIGLQHCKCGMSWKKDIGFFERTGGYSFRSGTEESREKDETVSGDPVQITKYGKQRKGSYRP